MFYKSNFVAKFIKWQANMIVHTLARAAITTRIHDRIFQRIQY
jgi:hypothetical protein